MSTAGKCNFNPNYLLKKKYSKECKMLSYDEYITDMLLYNKNTHYISLFKDFMIFDYIEEFLKRYYSKTESFERLPKISLYYKNYLKFFCHPMFKNFKVNNIIQAYGDDKAEVYYINNYGKSDKAAKGNKGNKLSNAKEDRKEPFYMKNKKQASLIKAKNEKIFDGTVIDFINGKNELKFIKKTLNSEHSSIDVLNENNQDSISIIKTIEAIKENDKFNTINSYINLYSQRKPSQYSNFNQASTKSRNKEGISMNSINGKSKNQEKARVITYLSRNKTSLVNKVKPTSTITTIMTSISKNTENGKNSILDKPLQIKQTDKKPKPVNINLDQNKENKQKFATINEDKLKISKLINNNATTSSSGKIIINKIISLKKNIVNLNINNLNKPFFNPEKDKSNQTKVKELINDMKNKNKKKTTTTTCKTVTNRSCNKSPKIFKMKSNNTIKTSQLEINITKTLCDSNNSKSINRIVQNGQNSIPINLKNLSIKESNNKIKVNRLSSNVSNNINTRNVNTLSKIIPNIPIPNPKTRNQRNFSLVRDVNTINYNQLNTINSLLNNGTNNILLTGMKKQNKPNPSIGIANKINIKNK